jgi:surface polysaccharide O-acyltransferase-like enzyme
VPLFVILTGALLLQPTKIDEPIGVFLKKRVKRLGYAFVFWTVIYLAWSFYITGTPFTFDNLLMGSVSSFLTGAFYQFWYIYLIGGLYLITPLLRAGIASKNSKLIGYLIKVWFISICVLPLLPLLTGYHLNGELFVMGGYSCYFLLGYYLQQNKLRRGYMYGFIAVGFALTLISTWVMTINVPLVENDYAFFDYLAINIILMSVGVYALLSRFPANWPGPEYPYIKKILKVISDNTLPVFLFHVIILETLARGLLGFTLNLTVVPLVMVPLASSVILFVTLGLILLMKKIPGLKKMVG